MANTVLGDARVRFRIIDVFYDYGSEKGYVVVDRSTMLHYLPDRAPSDIAVYLKPEASLDDARREVEQVVPGATS
ncbi:MAG: hypothetical protein P4M04_01670 [Acidobacteriota bacterium]|nr:hypothetical protein [Acidobacteriota bacterium]